MVLGTIMQGLGNDLYCGKCETYIYFLAVHLRSRQEDLLAEVGRVLVFNCETKFCGDAAEKDKKENNL